jgi:hypothetical protein
MKRLQCRTRPETHPWSRAIDPPQMRFQDRCSAMIVGIGNRIADVFCHSAKEFRGSLLQSRAKRIELADKPTGGGFIPRIPRGRKAQ